MQYKRKMITNILIEKIIKEAHALKKKNDERKTHPLYKL